MAEPDDANHWNEERVARWLRQAEGIERQLQPVSDALFATAALQPGEAVLDVGCGTGPTTRQAAVAVGPTGRVSGLDISGDMLAAAASVAVPGGAAPLDWIEADPVAWTPPGPDYDVVLSRFGVMFFSDPAAAFAALAAAARPGGRLAIATWATRDESDLFAVPLRATLAELGRDDPGMAEDEGPFSLHDPTAVADLLAGAGWSDARTAVHRLALPFGGGVDPATAATIALDFGPTRVVTADLDETDRSRVVAAIAEVFADHVDGDGLVLLDGAVLITTAQRSA